jgi:putative oxidoreductase
MLEKNMRSYTSIALLLLRLCVGAVFIGHGAQKLFGMFGGAGMTETVAAFETMGIFYPSYMAWVVACIEFFGGIGLVLGVFTRECGFLLAAVMAGAIYYVHGAHGFFLQNSGYEYNLVLMGASLAVFLSGSGYYSFDRMMFPRSRWRFVRDPSSIKLEPPSDPPVF